MGRHVTIMEISPYYEVNILPSHSKKTAIISWRVAKFLRPAEFYIYRKWDGGATWELLNETAVYGTTYADTTFNIQNKTSVPHYKVLALLDGDEYESPDVAVFAHTDRKAFGVAQNIIRSNYLQARQDGIPVLYYPAITNGKMSSALDDVTGQRNSAQCVTDIDATGDTETEDANDYGTYYAGGYYRPFITFIRLIGARVQRSNILDEGKFDETVQNAKFLAFPPVRTGDLVVDVSTDRRWLVGPSITAHLIKSIIPVSYDAFLTLQATTHPCYDVPVPSNYSYLLHQLTWPNHSQMI